MRIGILGGSFNPVHVGHLRLAVEACERLALDRVDLVPCSVPPHKDARGLLPFRLRAQAVQLALGDADGGPPLRLDSLEQERQGPSYTVDTLEAYGAREPDARLFFILGAGDLVALPSWKEGLSLPERTSLAVVPREREDLNAVAEFVSDHWPDAARQDISASAAVQALWRFPSGTELHYMPLPRIEISSTMLRRLWREGKSLLGLTPQPVIRLLEAHREQVSQTWA